MHPPATFVATHWERYAFRCRSNSVWAAGSCTSRDFVHDVRAAVLVRDPAVDLDSFFGAIEHALAVDYAARRTGGKPRTFKTLPQREKFLQAIRDAVAMHTSSGFGEIPDDDALETPDRSSNGLARAGALILRSLRSSRSRLDRVDRAILELKAQGMKNKTIAERLVLSPQAVGRRLGEISKLIRTSAMAELGNEHEA
jgi:DNA-directed RNA polymerase specialized sigma24 family protein